MTLRRQLNGLNGLNTTARTEHDCTTARSLTLSITRSVQCSVTPLRIPQGQHTPISEGGVAVSRFGRAAA